VGEQAYSKIAFVWARVRAVILRLPCRAALEDGRAGSVSMSLDFLLLFDQAKRRKEKNMNARLYDPVIARFFSPDNFVQIPEFTQAYNRYSYCLNNPLKYVDPSGNAYIQNDDDYGLSKDGRVTLLKETKDKFDRLIVLDDAGQKTSTQFKLKKDNWSDKTLLSDLAETGKRNNYIGSYAVGDESSQGAMFETFKFAADNTKVEWRADRFKSANGNIEFSVGTAHCMGKAISSEMMGHHTSSVQAFIHSHQGISRSGELGSMGFRGWVGKNQFAYDRSSDVGYKTNELAYQNALYYTYFPESGNVWNVRSNNIPAFIRNVNTYKGFFWGTLNTW
jgi:RHS repeat-associated protein